MLSLHWKSCLAMSLCVSRSALTQDSQLSAQEHAGTIVADRQHATHLIVHPGSVKYRAELHNAQLLASQYPGLAQPKMVPYHWLCQVQLTNTLVDIDTLEPPLPIFYHPQMSEDNKPLIAWVSVNVTRNTDEQPSEAQGSVEQRLSLGGALISTKRARADLLIVDESTQFAQKVRKERKEGKRWHQKLAERDWVDDCWNNKKLSWKVDDEGMDEDDEDLVRDMHPSSSGTGPGRPTGLYVAQLCLKVLLDADTLKVTDEQGHETSIPQQTMTSWRDT